jgi:hypothetical protein
MSVRLDGSIMNVYFQHIACSGAKALDLALVIHTAFTGKLWTRRSLSRVHHVSSELPSIPTDAPVVHVLCDQIESVKLLETQLT